MTLLGSTDLRNAMGRRAGRDPLIITPLLDESQIGRGAIDLRLGTEFLLLKWSKSSGVNPATHTAEMFAEAHDRVNVPIGECLWLHPRRFALAATMEFIKIPSDLGAYVVGRSSWGRLVLVVATAVFVHPGFGGCLTLELVNEGDSPIALWPGARIAQLSVHQAGTPVQITGVENDKYVAPVGPEPSKLSRESGEFNRLEEVGRNLRSRLS